MKDLPDMINKIFDPDEEPIKLVISAPNVKGAQYRQIQINKKNLSKGIYYQAEKYTDQQVFHDNISLEELKSYLLSLMEEYRQLESWSNRYHCSIRISKKGTPLFLRKKEDNQQMPALHGHDRKKNYLLPEGVPVAPLVDLGIQTTDGRIVRAMYDKYKQINRFLELVDDAVRASGLNAMRIVDFGCGKSYLTFIIYYYFNQIKGMEVQITGIDLKASVIDNCNGIAEKYGYKDLQFVQGDIQHYHTDQPVDMVISLHACDTATDYALYHAIAWEAKMILAAPCCQHELNGQMKSERLSALTRYGVVKERIAALMTDAIRGNILEVYGYKTQLLEFIDFQHSPKNIMIRGIKGNTSQNRKDKYAQEVRNLLAEFGVSPTLCELLNFQ